MADFTKINSSTPIHDFPEIYNENIDKLVEEIDKQLNGNNAPSGLKGKIRVSVNIFNEIAF